MSTVSKKTMTSPKRIEPEELNKQELMQYFGYKGFIGLVRLYLRFLYNWIIQSLARMSPHPGLACIFQRARGVKIGKHVMLCPLVNIDDVYPHLVTIEDYVSIGMNTMIFAHGHAGYCMALKLNYYPRVAKPVTIKRGAWIPPGCIILAGVTIGENSVLGAGTVVTKDVEPWTIVAGNPAKVVKKLEPVATEYDD